MLKQNAGLKSDLPIQTQMPMLNNGDSGTKGRVDYRPEAVVGPELGKGERKGKNI